MLKKILIFLCLLFLSLTWIFTQKRIDKTDYAKDKLKENLVYIPSGKMLKILSLGYDNIVSDMLWMKSVLYFGAHFENDKKYEWLYRYLDSVTDLDPQFYYPYFFGGLVLADEAGRPELANKLMEKEMCYIRKKWNVPFFIGYNYYFYLHKARTASYFIRETSYFDDAPKYLKGLYVLLSVQDSTNNLEVARAFAVEAFNRIQDPNIKMKLFKKIKKYDKEIFKTSNIDTSFSK